MLLPDLLSLVIAFKNSYPKSFSRNFKSFCEKFPRPLDSFCFEIIAEREISEHFKICTVASRFSNAFNIGSSDTFLASCNSFIRRNSLSEEIFLQRSHSRIYQEKAFIPLWNKRCACHSCMILAFKERKIFFTKLVKSGPLHKNLSPLIKIIDVLGIKTQKSPAAWDEGSRGTTQIQKKHVLFSLSLTQKYAEVSHGSSGAAPVFHVKAHTIRFLSANTL